MVRSSATVTKYRLSSGVPWPRFSRSPVTWTARTKLLPRSLTYSAPTRAMRIMCSTTVRESVSSMPPANSSSGDPFGAIR